MRFSLLNGMIENFCFANPLSSRTKSSSVDQSCSNESAVYSAFPLFSEMSRQILEALKSQRYSDENLFLRCRVESHHVFPGTFPVCLLYPVEDKLSSNII